MLSLIVSWERATNPLGKAALLVANLDAKSAVDGRVATPLGIGRHEMRLPAMGESAKSPDILEVGGGRGDEG